MFSKYSNVEVPKNYSGNRFRNTREIQTETKTHSASTYSATKSSVSPIYQEQASYIEDVQEVEDDIINEEESESIDQVDENEEASSSEKQKSSFSLADLLNGINAEDLLLICLIIFLSAESGINNNDIIIILSLLLAYHI